MLLRLAGQRGQLRRRNSGLSRRDPAAWGIWGRRRAKAPGGPCLIDSLPGEDV